MMTILLLMLEFVLWNPDFVYLVRLLSGEELQGYDSSNEDLISLNYDT